MPRLAVVVDYRYPRAARLRPAQREVDKELERASDLDREVGWCNVTSVHSTRCAQEAPSRTIVDAGARALSALKSWSYQYTNAPVPQRAPNARSNARLLVVSGREREHHECREKHHLQRTVNIMTPWWRMKDHLDASSESVQTVRDVRLGPVLGCCQSIIDSL